MPEHRIAANGLTHFVRDEGLADAPAAMLLHGFPDSADLWAAMTPTLVGAGFRIVVPDLRGFGRTDMATRTAAYDIYAGAVPDVLAILDALKLARVHLVGHDFGAAVAWALAAQAEGRFLTLTAVSVGHPRAFLSAGVEQKLKSWYIVVHQFCGLAEAIYRLNDWAFLRRFCAGKTDVAATIAMLKRRGRLTAGLRWYRANVGLARMLRPPPPGRLGEEIVRIPTMGVWSDGDRYLTEAQMSASARYVEAPWRYERMGAAGHWIPLDEPERLSALLIGHWRAHSR
jgi:pimeloyl-ACP methyl ester carboxylesterase